jgi:hypothetical protein
MFLKINPGRFQIYIRVFAVISFLLITFISIFALPVQASDLKQQNTSSIPTVTGTPSGVMATVLMGQENQINVRAGPGVFFEKVGILIPGQKVPVKGKSAGGDWILIEYVGIPGSQGWVYAPYVSLTPGEVPIVEPPPTPTPLYTTTIDPTLAAQFVTTPIPTRVFTFTPAPPITIPTFVDASGAATLGGVPMGLVILIIVGLGILIGIFALIQGR